MLVIVRILIMSSVCGSLVVRIKGQSYHMFLAFRHMSPALPELAIFFFPLSSICHWGDCTTSPSSKNHLIIFDLIYPESRAVWIVEMRWAGVWVHSGVWMVEQRGSGGRWGGGGRAQEVLTRERTEMKVDSPRLRASCHKWTDRRITWNLNWFLWVQERGRDGEKVNEISDICWPPLMECVSGRPKMEVTERAWTDSEMSFQEMTSESLFKTAAGQVQFQKHSLSLPAESKLLLLPFR